LATTNWRSESVGIGLLMRFSERMILRIGRIILDIEPGGIVVVVDATLLPIT